MHEFINGLEKVLFKALNLFQSVLQFILLLSVVLISVETFLRYALLLPHDFSDLLVLNFVLFSVLGGAGMTLYQKKQIRMDLFISKLKGRSLRIAEMVDSIATLLAAGLVTFFSLKFSLFLISVGAESETSIPIPHWLAPSALFLSMTLVSFVALLRLLNSLNSLLKE